MAFTDVGVTYLLVKSAEPDLMAMIDRLRGLVDSC
jgi:hypothetical protein